MVLNRVLRRKLKRRFWDLRTQELYFLKTGKIETVNRKRKEMKKIKKKFDEFIIFEKVKR